ncbi:MAG: hypothetical protein HY657_01855 [Acidobacteria bacterium]|nr:hypothetical protein [Acidobacteriota bacterium]
MLDVRGTTVGLPQDTSFLTPVPSGTVIPARAFGLDIGAHVYPLRLGAARLGLGANLLWARRATSPPTPTSTSTTTVTRTIPDVLAELRTLAPQVSVNFGTRDGWSYLSAGLGVMEVDVTRSGVGTRVSRDSGRLRSINVGGGARWFGNDHLAFGFDVRFHVIQAEARPVPLAQTPRTTLVSASAGISLR